MVRQSQLYIRERTCEGVENMMRMAVSEDYTIKINIKETRHVDDNTSRQNAHIKKSIKAIFKSL